MKLGGKLGGRGIGSAKFAYPIKGQTRDLVARRVGWSWLTYEKAKAVVDSGDEELVRIMDETGKVTLQK